MYREVYSEILSTVITSLTLQSKISQIFITYITILLRKSSARWLPPRSAILSNRTSVLLGVIKLDACTASIRCEVPGRQSAVHHTILIRLAGVLLAQYFVPEIIENVNISVQRSPVALYTHSREFREYFRGFYVIVFIGILAQNLKYFDEFDFVNLFLSHRPLPLYLSVLINYIITYFYTNAKKQAVPFMRHLGFWSFLPLFHSFISRFKSCWTVLIVRQTSSVKLRFFLGIKKDRATGSPLLGLVICHEIA